MSKINLPKIDSNEQNVEKLVDKLLIMRKELEYALMNLDEENVPIINNITEKAKMIEKDVEGNLSAITQNVEQINLRVEKDDIINQINISPESIDIIGTRVNLVGAVNVLSDITGELGTINTGILNAVTINSAVVNSANIDISESVSIGDKLFLSKSNFGNGIRWVNSGDGSMGDPEIYIDPASESIFIECAGGIYANGTKID